MHLLGQFGFSYVGLLFLLMLFIPNSIWAKHKPQEYDTKNENRILLLLERVGQILVTGSALLFSNFNLQRWTPWSWWLVAAFALMILYECWWLRYFKSKKALSDFYSSFLGVPVAGATLPVAAFLVLGIYGKVFLLVISVFIMGIGHIGIHLQHRKQLQSSHAKS